MELIFAFIEIRKVSRDDHVRNMLCGCAGFLSGAIFRSTRGPKAAMIAGSVGTLAAAALVAARNTIDHNL